MPDIKVYVPGKDKFIAAMVKALAFQFAGQSCVEGATGSFLDGHGYIVIHFRLDSHVPKFKRVLSKYLPQGALIND
ncbi:MAG TPA: hypothetical protein VN784_17360 [Candidatus Limnocylindrales bacterium]|nr:hypothetical protein [Candidatus Limnocylindrales bacterium]